MSIRRKYIRELVNRLLAEAYCESAPVDVEQIAKLRNAIVHRQSVEDNFSGYLFRNLQQASAVIGVNSNHHVNRQRFTIGHELGHFLLHAGDKLHIDRQFVMMRRDQQSSEGTNPEEMEANLFAAELLMPERFLVEDIQHLGSLDLLDEERITRLARKYRVSQHAMTIRLTHLGFLSA
jgi:Zn-dependent peptidase ImmA (M78 family)